MSESKRKCRALVKEKLSKLDKDIMFSKSQELSKRLRAFILQQYIQKEIGGYAPLADEADWTLGNDDLATSFPRMQEGEEMTFKKSLLSELVSTTAFNKVFKEPVNESEIVEPEVLLIPGMAFDKEGARLGRGKGFYDKYLTNKSLIKIGICFDEQLIDKVPVEGFDIGMDFIITDKQLIELKQ